MTSIQVKNVPDDVHRVLRTRAAAAGKSLQEYLLDQLVTSARSPTMDEVLHRVSLRSGGTLSLREAADDVRAERDARSDG